jgi:type IX secretion system PorP/SprF family membrane protein
MFKIYRMKNVLLILLFTTSLYHSLMAQDPGFSQFFASPLSLNPALTGKFNGVLRIAGNYRNQWPAVNNAFITSTVSIDAPILKDHLAETDTWGVGMMAMSDRTASGILTSNYLAFSTSYHKALDEDGLNTLGIGFQGTYASLNLDGPKLNFADGLQLDGTWIQSPTEAINAENITVNYFDMNAGALYNGSTNGSNNYYFGASVYHINHPKESFLGNDDVVVPMRLTLHTGGYFPSANSNTTLYFSGLFSSQSTAKEFVLGGAVEINADNNPQSPTNFYIGSWVRFSNVTDAIIPYIGLDFGSFNLGMTYDVNVSAFKTASESRGGIEISLIYIRKKSDDQSPHGIPCPRF